jgi:hypothetical protein
MRDEGVAGQLGLLDLGASWPHPVKSNRAQVQPRGHSSADHQFLDPVLNLPGSETRFVAYETHDLTVG